MPAWWSAGVADFLQCEPEAIVGALSTRLVETHPLNRATQVQAWRAQVALLRQALAHAPGNWCLLLEYPLLRLGRRIDAVLLTDAVIMVLEFKVGSSTFSNIDRQQVEDYALDLLDFHAESRRFPLVPILVATGAEARAWQWPLLWHGVTPVFNSGAAVLADLLRQIAARVPQAEPALDPVAWEAAAYRPVPTIVEAATMLYSRHSVAEIAAARADVGNLTRTTEAIRTAIRSAAASRLHEVVFVTGIPGARLGAVLEPAVLAAVDLDQLTKRRAPPAWLMKRPSLLPRQPQTGFDHPLPHCFGGNLQTMQFGELFGRQRRAEVRVPFADQCDRMVPKLRRDLPVGRMTA